LGSAGAARAGFTLSGLVLACCAPMTDLSRAYDRGGNRFCEVAFGDAVDTLAVDHRPFPVAMEEGVEQRSRARLCGGTVAAELAFDLDRRLYRIRLREPGQCLEGVCVGDRFARASRQPGLEPFIAAAEGGFLELRSSRPDLAYEFDPGRTPIRCFRSLDQCPAMVNRKRVTAIVISR
jgi:hypothetical protein